MEWIWTFFSFLVKWGAWIFRLLRGRRILVPIRDRMGIGMIAPLHYQVAHTMRRLSSLTDTRLPNQDDAAAEVAVRVCNECRDIMCRALELGANDLHCCLKMLIPGASSGAPERVATFARSEPSDNRPAETGETNAHEIQSNTVWSSMMGISDGTTHWRPFCCFASNDLWTAGKLFHCDRTDWNQYYRSAFVFPIRYPRRAASGEFVYVGFLAFDSPKNNAFLGLPNIFEHRDDPTGYRGKLEKKMAFNLGALMADILGTCLYPNRDDILFQEEKHAAA